ncbi:MAG: hypothetical protein ABI791_14330 [Acidobacteriota bacterium]
MSDHQLQIGVNVNLTKKDQNMTQSGKNMTAIEITRQSPSRTTNTLVMKIDHSHHHLLAGT